MEALFLDLEVDAEASVMMLSLVSKRKGRGSVRLAIVRPASGVSQACELRMPSDSDLDATV